MAVNKDVYQMLEKLLDEKKLRFDWFLHVLDDECRVKIQKLGAEGGLYVFPFAIILSVPDEETGELTKEGTIVVKFFDGTKALQQVNAAQAGDGTYDEDASKEGVIYPGGAPASFKELKEQYKKIEEKMDENSEHGEAVSPADPVPTVPSDPDNTER